MAKYLLKRILFSLFALIVVTGIVMVLVYTYTNRNDLLKSDDNWKKRSGNEQKLYEYTVFQRYGYLEFVDYTTFLKTKYLETEGESYTQNEDYKKAKNAISDSATFQDYPDVAEFIDKYYGEGYDFVYMPVLKYASGKEKAGGGAILLAVSEKSVWNRLWDYITGFITFESKYDVEDENLTDRYIRWEDDPYSKLPALVGSGTKHKYLIYFDSRFPFIHQNLIKINLGISSVTYKNQEITDVINTPTGDMKVVTVQYPTQLGTDQYTETSIDFHSVTYNNAGVSDSDRAIFTDNYTVYSYQKKGLTMLENSFIIGFIATVIAYLMGLPFGIFMSRHKDGLADKTGNFYIIFMMSVPSLAYIFLFATIGTTLFGFPYKFATSTTKIGGYILPVICLALPGLGNVMRWIRRYMIDQMNADYVKFAKAEGLSEQEIFSGHIFPNAMVYLMQGLPGSILGCLTGAIITERVFAVPGVGGLLTTAIDSKDNGIIIACTVFYTFLTILSIILGDLLLSRYDPRVSLTDGKGGGR